MSPLLYWIERSQAKGNWLWLQIQYEAFAILVVMKNTTGRIIPSKYCLVVPFCRTYKICIFLTNLLKLIEKSNTITITNANLWNAENGHAIIHLVAHFISFVMMRNKP